ncbi:molybdopterin cofactor-binding domain-containing protein [uncultured Cyclobacterium sp.]|uniref:xanthine dehydrogenase family protein molybdopterin-binding subunit n=1 Tax=uncultured Cyclobacterium sp. TaxID=453820 RepID=UPI0030EBE83D|tara:strand:- start:88221 stop:90353 length:2133 start_codon:yes stop_codon:yes gene_type:complete
MKSKPSKKESPVTSNPAKVIGDISRRSFFKYMGAGVAAYIVWSDIFVASAVQTNPKHSTFPDQELISSWIHIAPTGDITVFTGKVEIGQNIRTSLSQVVAEELFVAPEAINMVMGDTALTPYDRGTYGSLTTLQISPILRVAAANIREILVEEAQKTWGVKSSSLTLSDGMVIDPASNKMLAYGDLVKDKKLFKKVNRKVKTIAPEEWKVAGHSIPKMNGKDFITGKHRYVSDMVLPGMVFGKVLRPPAYGAKLLSADTSEAEKIPGVIVCKEDNFIGVTAANPLTAAIALASIESSWDRSAPVQRSELFKHLVDTAAEKKIVSEAMGDAYDQGNVKLDRNFEIAYIAHVPLETRAALASWKLGHLEVWAGTQRPFGLHEDLQKTFDLPEDSIRVYVPDTGSGYGGKQTSEVGLEAARLAKHVGKPVKVCWTREEEFKWAYFRPAGVIQVRASLSNGEISSWEFHNFNSGSAGIDFPYIGGKRHLEFHRSSTPLRQGSYRALSSTANVFAMESIVNDLAIAAGEDPLQFRLRNLENPRLKAVIKAASETFGWERQGSQENIGFGMACGTVKGGFVATFVEVEVEKGSRKLIVREVVTAFECGVIINPRHLESQVTGCVLQGLGGALFEEIDFRDGNLTNASLGSYRVPRFKDVPKMSVVLLNRTDLPSSGAGEAPIVGIAPALRNAIDDASGVKLYKLPMLPSGIVPDKA